MLKSPLPPPHHPLPSPIQEIRLPVLQQKKIRLLVKRDDLLHPEISGNKWRKLRLNLKAALVEDAEALLTFGGAYSNHILAVAAAGHHLGLRSIGIIRGEPAYATNPTLSRVQQLGMELMFVSRTAYRQKAEILARLSLDEKVFVIPEGGSNALAVRGCGAIVQEVKTQLAELPDYWCCSVGTGGTVAGIIHALNGQAQVTGFSSLKGDFLTKEVQQLLEMVQKNPPQNWHINTSYHFGGYAKHKPELLKFIQDFETTSGIPLEHVYTGKLFFGLLDLIEKDYFPSGSRVLAIHTGGLQGKQRG